MSATTTDLMIATLMPTALVILSVACYWKRRRQIRQARKQGIQLLLKLKQLLMAIQQHRGLSYGALNGDTAMARRIPPLETTIRNLVQQLDGIGALPLAADYWAAATNHLNRLLPRNLALTPENNLEQHNRLIGVLLYLFENVAEASHLGHERTSDGQQADVLWRQVLQAAEWLGQARAFGSGVLASGMCGSVERIRISFIRSRIESVAVPVREQIADRQVLVQAITAIDRNFLELAEPDISARDYFDLVSQAIDKVLSHFDEKMQELSQALTAR